MDETLENGWPLDSIIDSSRLPLYVTPEMPCPYLPGQHSRSEAYFFEYMEGAAYEKLIARGYRRSGRVVYKPLCQDCTECKQIRIPVADFTPSKSMRRVERRNQDVIMTVQEPIPTDEKFEIFLAYLDAQHDDMMPRTQQSFVEFLYDSPMDTLEFTYRVGNRIAGITIADQCPGGLSSVYCYFDPEFSDRSLGTLSVVREVGHCRDVSLPYYYLGFYIAKSPTMAYKARFRPNEILVADETWTTNGG